MRRVLTYSLLLLLLSCSRRSDIVFSAYDDLHSLTLYQQNYEFEMLYNGFNTVEGNYHFRNDTIFLTYSANEYLGSDSGKERHANEILTRTITLDKKKKRINSLNGKQFCGQIDINELK